MWYVPFVCVYLVMSVLRVVLLRCFWLAPVIAAARGGTIHRRIDISRYFSRDTYRDIIF